MSAPDAWVLLPLVVAGVLVGGVGLLAVALRPLAAILLAVAILVSNASSVVGPVGPFSGFVLALGVLAAALVVGLRKGTVRLIWSPVYLFALLYLATRAASLLVATDAATGLATVAAEVSDLVLLGLLVPLLASLPRPRPVAMVAVGVLAVLAGLTVVQEFVLNNSTTFGGFSNVPVGRDIGATTVRHSGPLGDANFWARLLVLFFPLALTLGFDLHRGRGRWRARPVWLAAAAAILAGVYLSQSRGGLLALAAAALVWLLLSGLRARRVAAVVAVGLAAALLLPGVSSRLGTLGLATEEHPSVSDRSLADRAAVQRVGVAMFVDNPVLGVGAGNFEVREPEYRRRYGPDLSAVIAPHNLYLQMLVEGGLIGLLGWLALYGGTLFLAARVLLVERRFGHEAVRPAGGLAAAVLAGMTGWALASVFLHLSDLRVLVVVIALAAALDVGAREAIVAARSGLVSRGAPASSGALPPRPHRRAALLGLGVSAVVATGAGGAVAATQAAGARWTATARAVVEPADSASATPYVQDVLSRPPTVATYAVLAASPELQREARALAGLPPGTDQRLSVTVTPHAVANVFDIKVTAEHGATAERLASATLQVVQRYVDSLQSLYAVRPAPATGLVLERSRSRPDAAAALLVSGLLGCLYFGLRLRRASR